MLQQPPEYKRLPLHGKRLSTENFDKSPPKTASHAFSFFTNPGPTPSLCDSTPTHSKTQSSMYYDEPRFQNDHHQQPHRFVRGEVATKLWPQQGQNYWFPNWQELFHGFLVVQEGQPRQTIVAGLEESRGVTCPQQQHTTPPSPHSGTQRLHWSTASATQSPHWSAPLSQQQPISSPVPCSGMCSGVDTATESTHPSPTVSHAVVQPPALPLHEEVDHTQSGHDQVACPPSTQAPGSISKYIIKSPVWLPQGWVTEIHMRQTGTTAGTQDKYYKHLVSGRRFRSKNEVLHFISTGKGRTRKRDRRKKALALSAASHSFIAHYAHKKHTTLEASKPSSRGRLQSCPENKHPAHEGMSQLPGQWAELRPNGDSGPPSKQSISLSSCCSLRRPGNMLLTSKELAQERPHKLPLKKKAKTLPPKMGDHKQASKLWQWLKQPVARENGEPLNQAVHILNFSVPGVEKKASAIVDHRGVDNLQLRDQTTQRTIQLGREIQAAHKVVVQMSREMQATAEKFSREIQEAQKDVEWGSGMKPRTVPSEKDVELIHKTKAGKRCRATEAAASRPYATKPSVVQASHGHDVATKNLPQAAEWPFFTLGNVTHAVQRPDDPIGILAQGEPRLHASTQATDSAMDAATQRRSPTQVTQVPVVGMGPATQLALWPDAAPHHGTQSASVAKDEAAKRHVDAASDATRSAQMAFATAINGIHAVQRHVVETIRVQQQTKENVTVGYVTQPALRPEVSAVHTRQPIQIAYIAMGSDTQAAERCVLVAGRTTQPTPMAYMGNGTQATQRHVAAASHYTQTAEVDRVTVSNVAQAAQRQIITMGNLLPAATQRPDISIGRAIASLQNPPGANELDNVVHRAAGTTYANPIYAAQLSASCGGSQPSQKLNLRRQKEEMKERYLRRKKFSAVLNPKLDLSRLNPALTTRQRAKVVQRMKARHARDMLATLGRHLCHRAIQKKAMAKHST